MSESRCDRCGTTLKRGATRYVLGLRVTCDWDGYLPEPEPGASPAALIQSLDYLSADEADAEVDLKLAFTVCPPCRAHILADPLQRGERSDGPGQVH